MIRPRGSIHLRWRLLALMWGACCSTAAAGLATASVAFNHEATTATPPLPSYVRAELGSLAGGLPYDAQVGSALSPQMAVSLGLGQEEVSIASLDAGTRPVQAWSNGAARVTAFGSESAVLRPRGAEENLTVSQHLGVHTWRWQVNSALSPRLGADGAVGFFASGRGARRLISAIAAPAIYDDAGNNVTPAGLHWQTSGSGADLKLELQLDDASLPPSYTIDPALLRVAGTVASTKQGTTLATTLPTGWAAQDLFLLHIAQNAQSALACPTGWNTANLAGGGTSDVGVGGGLEQIDCWRDAQAGDTAPTVTHVKNAYTDALIEDYEGVDTSLAGTTPGPNSPLAQAAAAAYTNATAAAATQFPALSAATTMANEVVVGFGSNASGDTWPTSAGTSPWTYTIEASGSPSGGVTVGSGDVTIASAGTAAAAATITLSSATGVATGMTYGLTNATTAPSGGTISAPAAVSTPSVTLTTTNYTDTADAMASNSLFRTNGLAPAAGDACPASGYSGSTAVSSPDTTVTAGSCYVYLLVGTDAAGNASSVSTSPVLVTSPDGYGNMGVSPASAAPGSTAQTFTFTYTAAAGGLRGGALTLQVPAGWSAPQGASGTAGYTTSNCGGTPAFSGTGPWTVTVSGVNLSGTATCTITYGSGGGTSGVSVTSTAGAYTFSAGEKSLSSGTLTPLSSSPGVTVLTPTATAVASGTNPSEVGQSVNFTATVSGYTGSVSGEAVYFCNGNTPCSTGSPNYLGSGTLSSGAQASYATTALSAGSDTVYATYSGDASNAASTGSVGQTVYSADGFGNMSVSPATNAPGATAQTFTFTYKAAAGGTSGGALSLQVPAGWSAPQGSSGSAGYTISNCGGTPAFSGSGPWTVTVTGVTLASNATCTITYGSGGGASGVAVSSTAGLYTFTTQEKSLSGGTLATLSSGSPTVTVLTPTTTALTSGTNPSRSGQSVTFTATVTGYSGAVTAEAVYFCNGSTPCSTGSGGYLGSGTLSSGGLATYSTTVLPSGSDTVYATYAGDAVNASSTGSVVQSVYAADGSGTMTVLPASVAPGAAAQTFTFTYTAATGGMSGGSVTLQVPTGWSAPQGTSGTAGYTTSNCGGTPAFSGAGPWTVSVTGVTLAANATCIITYGAGGGASGVTASSTMGPATFTTQQRSTAAGTLTNIATAPVVTVLTPTTTALASSANPGTVGVSITFTATITGYTGNINHESVYFCNGNTPCGTGSPNYLGTGTLNSSGVATYSTAALPGGSDVIYATYAGDGSNNSSTGSVTQLLYSPDGAGNMSASPATEATQATQQELIFTYTAASGGASSGSLTLQVPAGWTAPQGIAGSAGYTTSNCGGSPSFSGTGPWTITVAGVTIAGGASCRIDYGSGGGTSGVTVTTTSGPSVFTAKENSTAGGTLTGLGTAPQVTVQGGISVSVPVSVSLGTTAPGTTLGAASLGSISFSNTLADGLSWSVTIQSTDLYNSGNGKLIYFTQMSVTPGSVSPSGPSAGSGGTFSGGDTTPGTTLSNPVTLVTGAGSDQGSWSQSNTLTVKVPANLGGSGTLTGIAQYTITG